MTFFRSLAIMMSLYTRIPMPEMEWNPGNTKYVLTLLPVSGLLSGAAEAVWFSVSLIIGIHAPLYAAIACGLPVIVHGGIHLDGLADTADARASCTSKEKRRSILADPHTGAFGAAAIVFYEMVTFGLFCEIFTLAEHQKKASILLLLLFSYIIPRALVQSATVLLPPSVPGGMLYSLTSAADRRLNLITSVGIIALCSVLIGVSSGYAVVVFVTLAILVILYFRNMALKQFGGISGDLCGWLIKITETVMLASLWVTLEWL